MLSVIFVIGTAHVHAWLVPGPKQSPTLPVWVLHTKSKAEEFLHCLPLLSKVKHLDFYYTDGIEVLYVHSSSPRGEFKQLP